MIAYGMLYTITAGAPIALAAFFGAGYLRSHGRSERGVWLLALVLAAAVPFLGRSRLDAAAPTPTPTTTVAPSTPWPALLETRVIELPAVTYDPATAALTLPPANLPLPLDELLIGLWIFASMILAMRWAMSSFDLERLSRSWRTGEVDGVHVLVAPDLGPAVFGLVRPRIVVPEWTLELPVDQRALVLLHEQEHVRARDPWLIGLGRTLRVLLPWNPIVWLTTRWLRRAIELDCDRRVLARRPDVGAYGAALLTVSGLSSRRLIAAAAFAESEVPLRRRILAMTTPSRPLSIVGIFVIIATGVSISSSALAVPVPVVRAAQATAAPQGVLREPRVVADPAAGRADVIDRLFQPWRVVLAAPVGSWFPVADEPRKGFVVEAIWPGGSYGWLPLTANPGLAARFRAGLVVDRADSIPLPTLEGARELSALPRILNPDEIAAAIEEAYPRGLRVDGRGGTVGMLFHMGVTGAVQETRLGQISAHREMDEAARRVANVYRFAPAELDGEPIPVWVSHAIEFRAP